MAISKDTRIEDQPAPLHSLLAAPLEALCAAQSIAQVEALQRHLEAGLDEKGQARVLRIGFAHHAPDPLNVGKTNEVPAVLEVPVLSLMKLPALEVSEAEVELAVVLKSLPTDFGKSTASSAAAPSRPAGQAVLAAYADATKSLAPTVHFKLKLKSVRQREGALQLERTLTDAIRAQARAPTPPKDA